MAWASDNVRHSSNSSPDSGRLVVVSGPSGVGKSSVVEGLASRVPFRFSVSVTTRAPRPDEVEGVDYTFVDEKRFREMVAGDELLEWAQYSDKLYGTPRAAVAEFLAAGHDVVLDIENRGAAQIRESHPEAILIFVAPPSLDELERRLKARGNTRDVEKRLAVASEQITSAQALYDHIVVNDDLDTAICDIADILARPGRLGHASEDAQETPS